ncbi:MAG TPA: metallopeptidase family protein [Pirellulaceae bacterium]|nr:metallopeptidase family protein [Pirellulaceae bacterium]
MLTLEERQYFDEHLEFVLSQLPLMVKNLIEQIPLVVEDYPAKNVLDRVGLKFRDQLCGLYVGISLDKKSVEASGQPADTVYLFREGILNEAADDEGYYTDDSVREAIRITILHEYGHHHGLDEDELRALGY